MYEQAGAPGREGGTLFSVAGSLRDPNRFKFDSQMPMVLAGAGVNRVTDFGEIRLHSSLTDER